MSAMLFWGQQYCYSELLLFRSLKFGKVQKSQWSARVRMNRPCWLACQEVVSYNKYTQTLLSDRSFPLIDKSWSDSFIKRSSKFDWRRQAGKEMILLLIDSSAKKSFSTSRRGNWLTCQKLPHERISSLNKGCGRSVTFYQIKLV